MNKDAVKGALYGGSAGAISTALVALVVTYRPELADIEYILIVGLIPIVNGILVVLKNEFSKTQNNA
jgi:cadmium resistance protein CadD (predicted permease)